jgi:hypothetical protein
MKESTNMLRHPLNLPMGQTHMPDNRFNLFHIDASEIHFDCLNASLFYAGDLAPQENIQADSPHLLQNGHLHLCSRSLVFDQDAPQPTSIAQATDHEGLEPLVKFRFNRRFDFEMLAGYQLETYQDKGGKGALVEEFYRYLLLQTFQDELNLGTVVDYQELLDASSLGQFREDL